MNFLETIQNQVSNGNYNFKNLGEIEATVSSDGSLILLNYAYPKHWNAYECLCRGLILEAKTGNVIARGFDKFWNWEDNRDDNPVEITEKLDGSLILVFKYNNEMRTTTRGSFTSVQALHAAQLLTNYNLSNLPENLTFLFEIIYPENHIVVNYGNRDELILIGVRDRLTGDDYFYDQYISLAHYYNFKTPTIFTEKDIHYYVKWAKDLPVDFEGWVLRYADGTRYKIKGTNYFYANKLLYGMTYARLLDIFAKGAYNDFIAGAPPEIVAELSPYLARITDEVAYYKDEVRKAFLWAPKHTRKEFAIWSRSNYPELFHMLMNKFDNRDYTQLIYKELKRDLY